MGNFSLLFLVALGLAMDCFAVAVSGGIGSAGSHPFKAIRVAFFFGFFQALMPVLGWLCGERVTGFIASYDHWAAFGLLAFIGGRMIFEALREEGEARSIDKLGTLLVLSFSTSLDAFAVGLSFALLKQPILTGSLTIGLVTFVVSLAGIFIGRKAGMLLGRKAEILGGAILIIIGIKILLAG